MQNTMIPRLRYFTISLVAGLAMAAVGSAIAINTFKPKHEAKLFFRVIHNREWLICFRGAGETDDQTVASWINSEVISNLVAIDPRVAGLDEIRNAGNPAAKLMAMADVTSEGGNGLFAIAVRSEVPAHAALIAETYWEKYEESQKLAREQQSKLLMEALDSEIAAYKKQVKLLEMDLQEARKRMDESASAEEKEYATVKLDYELKNKNYEKERGRLLSYIQRRREIQLQQIGPFSITREYMTDENKGLPVFEQPVEKYPWKQLFELLRSIPDGRATDLQASLSGNPGTDCGRFSITGSVTKGWNAPSESMNVQSFVDLLTSGGFQPEADINQDGAVTLLDVDPFVALLAGG